MDSLKLRGSNEAERSTASGVNEYVLDARDRLRRLASRASGPALPLSPSLPAKAAAANPIAVAPTPTAEASPPHPAKVSSRGVDNLRAAVVDRAVDRLVDRLLLQWERGGQPASRLDEHLIDRLVERLVNTLDAGS